MIIGLENQFLVFLTVAVLDRFYCILFLKNKLHLLVSVIYMIYVCVDLSSKLDGSLVRYWGLPVILMLE